MEDKDLTDVTVACVDGKQVELGSQNYPGSFKSILHWYFEKKQAPTPFGMFKWQNI